MNIFYTNFGIPKQFAGMTRGPFVFIRPEYKDDIGLLAHEQTHVKQFFRTFFLHGFFYLFSDTYKLNAEVEAFKVQATYYSGDTLPQFAEFIANNYGLNITAEEALTKLRA